MYYLSPTDIKQEELKILIKFDEFCRNHNLKYSLMGGTLLGAIRHKGFIPWDDDIDVSMPRPDYERFLALGEEFDKSGLYFVASVKNGFQFPYCKILNKKIQVETLHSKAEIDTFLWIDVLPVDALPDNEADVFQIYKKVSKYRRILQLSDTVWKNADGFCGKIGKFFLQYPAKIYGKRKATNRIIGIATKRNYFSSEYCGVIAWGLYGKGERIRRNQYENLVLVEFEGYSFFAMSNWDEYLCGIYGSYMELPSIEKRVAHGLKAWIIE